MNFCGTTCTKIFFLAEFSVNFQEFFLSPHLSFSKLLEKCTLYNISSKIKFPTFNLLVGCSNKIFNFQRSKDTKIFKKINAHHLYTNAVPQCLLMFYAMI